MAKSKAPKLDLNNTPWQNQMEILSILALVLLIGMVLYYFPSLPDRIPTHFNLKGEADGWGNKLMLFTLPAIGFGLYLLLTFINRTPHLFNYPIEVTEENAEKLYQIGRSLNTTLKAFILCSFLYIAWSSIQLALGNQSELGYLFMALFIGGITAIIVVHLRMNNEVKKEF